MTTGGGSFDVSPDALRRFARHLQTQADELRAGVPDVAALESLSARPGLFGLLPEAEDLATVSVLALRRVQELIARLDELIVFAEGVARDVAERYEHLDDAAGAEYAGLRPHDPGLPLRPTERM